VIVDLTFAGASRLRDGRTVRRLTSTPRAILQLESICRLANAVGDRLGELLASPVSIAVVEPIALENDMLARLLGGAYVLRAHGEATDAFVIVRQPDARGLVDFAFARTAQRRTFPLSVLEGRLVRQVLRDVAAACVPLCGRLDDVAVATPQAAAREATVYFEMRVLGPLRAAVGIAVTRVPRAGGAATLGARDLRRVRVQARATLGRGRITLAGVGLLEVGSVISLDSVLDDLGTLEIDGHVVARGRCGVEENRVAFQVTETPAHADAHERG